MDNRVKVDLTDEQRAGIEELHRRTGTSRAELIRQAVMLLLDQKLPKF